MSVKSPRDKEKYSNLKAELYWQFRERASSGDLAGLTDEKTIAQLAGIRYSHNSRGQIVIESKQDARKRGVKSPDRAEAVILAFADQPKIAILEFYRQQVEEVQPTGVAVPRMCPQCGSRPLFKHGGVWRCVICSATGVVVRAWARTANVEPTRGLASW
jgi:hypothetical protein